MRAVVERLRRHAELTERLHRRDHASNFVTFGRKLQLPQTAVIALNGPLPYPSEEAPEGRTWFGDSPDEEVALLEKCVTDLTAVIERIVGSGYFKHRQLHLCGFSDGGQVRDQCSVCGLLSPQLSSCGCVLSMHIAYFAWGATSSACLCAAALAPSPSPRALEWRLTPSPPVSPIHPGGSGACAPTPRPNGAGQLRGPVGGTDVDT